MTTGRTTSGPKNAGDRPVLGQEAQPLLKRSGLWSDELPWRRPLLTPSLMWTGDLDWSGAGWGRDTRGRIRRLSWRLSYVWLAALARGDVMDPALLRFRRMLNGDFSRPLEGPQHARHTLPALKDQQRIRTSQRARAPLPTRAPTARTREVWIPTQKEATSPPQKWQREQRKAEVQHRQPLPSSPLRPSTQKSVESLVGVSSDSSSSTKTRTKVPDTVTPTVSSTSDRGASAGGVTQKRDVASATTAAKPAQRTPHPSAVVGAATEAHRETQNLSKGTRQTDTTPTNRQSRTSAVSGESSGDRSEQSATVQSSEKARVRDTTQSSVPTGTTPGTKRPSGSGIGKIQSVGRDRSQSTAKYRESSPKTSVWAKTD